MNDLLSVLQRNAHVVIALFLATYAISFAAFYPEDSTIKDEARYLRQADFLSAGRVSVLKPNPLTGEQEVQRPGRYPIGTAVLMLPFVELFGRRGAFAVPCLSLLFAVAMTAVWIRSQGRSPLFALVILGFPAALVMGRAATSDVVSMIPVSLGLWCFWRGVMENGEGGPFSWLCAGFLAGVSISFRESNALIFAFLFLGALIRRDRNVWALVVSGGVGVALRLLSSWILYDASFFFKKPDGLFSFDAIASIPQYLVGLMIFIPAGLLAGLVVRGRRAPELRVTVALFVSFYLAYGYSGEESGPLKSLVLGQRFFLPLLPILAFALAEVVPRWWQSLTSGWSDRRVRSLSSWAVAGWLIGLLAACVAVHPVLSTWGRSQVRLRQAIADHVDSSAVLVTNLNSTEKLIRRFDYTWTPLDRKELSQDDALTLLDRHGEFYLVLLDRNESEFRRDDAKQNAAFSAALGPLAALVLEDAVTRNEKLKIWHVSRGSGAARRPNGGRDEAGAAEPGAAERAEWFRP